MWTFFKKLISFIYSFIIIKRQRRVISDIFVNDSTEQDLKS